MKFALQLYSIRDIVSVDIRTAIEVAAKAGYDGVEFAGYGGLTSAEIKAELEKHGLEAAGTHISLKACDEDLEGVVKYCKEIGCYSAVIPFIKKFEEYDDCVAHAKRLEEIGKRFNEEGIVFGYHNHDFEFWKLNDKYMIDVILENTTFENVKWEMDTHWVYKGGEDTTEFPKKYYNRLPIIHAKDVAPGGGENAEVGEGILDYPAIIKACGNVEWVVVEQELFDRDKRESVKISCDNLHKMFSK